MLRFLLAAAQQIPEDFSGFAEKRMDLSTSSSARAMTMQKILFTHMQSQVRVSLRIIFLLLGFLLQMDCKPRYTEASIQGTSRSEQSNRCNDILVNMKKVAMPIFVQVMAVADGKTVVGNKMAMQIAAGTKQMFENMMRSAQTPVLPLYFFAMIKDFETSARKSHWSKPNQRKSAISSGKCTSGPCFGYFQVDVRLERPVWNPAICESGGLDIAKLEGGYDFCAALFWWIRGEGGRKCQRLVSGTSEHSLNPCRDKNVTWTENYVAKGRKAYGQGLQDGGYANENGWKDKYNDYIKCDSERHALSKADLAHQFMQAIRPEGQFPGTDPMDDQSNIGIREEHPIYGSRFSTSYADPDRNEITSQAHVQDIGGNSAGDFEGINQKILDPNDTDDFINDFGFDEQALKIHKLEFLPDSASITGRIDLAISFPNNNSVMLEISGFGKGDGYIARRITKDGFPLVAGQTKFHQIISSRQEVLWLYLDWYDRDDILVFSHAIDFRGKRPQNNQ